MTVIIISKINENKAIIDKRIVFPNIISIKLNKFHSNDPKDEIKLKK
ncbi:hypothetical protein [Methanobacterium arcticum]|jgi:hypothetical protein|nr:hypothetical protein [Methanobacterium arcticum]